MYFEYKEPKLNAILRLTDNVGLITEGAGIDSGLIHILWNRADTTVVFHVDDLPVSLAPNQISTCTYYQQVRFDYPLPNLTVFSFNKPFYCVLDHDYEVSCSGILFFGTQDLPIFTVPDNEMEKIETLLNVFVDEFETKDDIQGEMLQMLLKRLIIKCTRMAREQLVPKKLDINQIDIIRHFNVLVDMNFKKYRLVSEYADLLHKSPKTLSNLFSLYGDKTPLRIIHERIVLEAKRLLKSTDKTAKEIATHLGFGDMSAFNKMFKKVTGCAPIDYKKSLIV